MWWYIYKTSHSADGTSEKTENKNLYKTVEIYHKVWNNKIRMGHLYMYNY